MLLQAVGDEMKSMTDQEYRLLKESISHRERKEKIMQDILSKIYRLWNNGHGDIEEFASLMEFAKCLGR